MERHTEGFSPQDLKRLAAQVGSSVPRTSGDLVDIIARAEPLSVAQNAVKPLEGSSRRKFEDLGGLEHVKKSLTESVIWPSKVKSSVCPNKKPEFRGKYFNCCLFLQYPKLFANCSLRLRSGILLYGAPGTGKTALVEALANQTKFNFISIKVTV